MKKSKGRHPKYKKLGTAKRKTNRQILPALAVVGGACGLAASPASALELGEIRVDSALGQPLRASIAYALAPNEQMFDFCIFLRPGTTANGMPVVSNARVTITDNAIVLNGRMPIREPLLALRLSVNCPYTANLARDYTLMIDPPLSGEGERAALSTERPSITPLPATTVTASDVPLERDIPGTVKPTPIPRRTARRPRDETPIAASSRYHVQAGDSLSQIVARIEGRSMPLWPAVTAVFAANPHAFLDNDPNLLQAGSWLDIPDLSDEAAIATLAGSQAVAEPATEMPTAAAYSGVATPDTASAPETAAEPAAAVPDEFQPETLPQAEQLAAEPAPVTEPVATPELLTETADESAPLAEPVEEPAASEPRLRPGDFVIGTDNPFVVPLGSDDAVIDIPDSELRGPEVAQPAPSVAVTAENERGISGGWAWLFWLGGAGLAMILGLFLFGRQLREYFGAVPVAIPAVPQRRSDDRQPQRSLAEIDYNFDATTITGRKISLDADLDDGTGLQESDDMHVAQDFAFSAAEPQVDMEIPELPVEEVELSPTDILPAPEHEDTSILETEVLPVGHDADDEDEEDYSVSMNVDATKQILDDNTATTKDLQAILVDTQTDIPDDDTGEYTLSRSAEYQILEQDYEEELSATQALNKEIEEAARALAEQMEDAGSGGDTKKMPSSQDPEMSAELTANLETQGDAQNDEFVESRAHPDLTVEMPVSDGDETLDVESPLIESEKKEASSG